MDLSALEKYLGIEVVSEILNGCSGTTNHKNASYEGRLCEALKTIATLIKNGNENLWPIFEKLETELMTIQEREDRLSSYL